MNNFNDALLLLIIGMVSVFIILSIVVLSGRLLIYLVNRYAKLATYQNQKINTLNPKHVAVISSAVQAVVDEPVSSLKIEKL